MYCRRRRGGPFYEGQLGTQRKLLLESDFKEGYMHGFTENYVKVKTLWNPDMVNKEFDIELKKIDEDGSVLFEFKTPVATFA